MFPTSRWLALTAVLLLGFLAPVPAVAREPIRDEGKFFDEATIRRATNEIRSIQERYKREVVVETYAQVPADREKEFKDQGKDLFFKTWARERFRELGVDGVYILICKKPAHFEIEIGNETGKAFSREDRKELSQILKDNLAKQPNQALLEAISHIERVLARHHNALPHGGHRGGGLLPGGLMGWVCMGLVFLVVLWLVFALIRAFSGGGGGGYGGGYGGGGGGGGFFPSLLGGLFGAAAGMWIYDSFFGHGGSSASGGTPDAGSGPEYGQDTDSSSMGGDFGGDDGDGGAEGGGGDFGDGGDFGGGGGDFGGGDFGGGDFGGGGGDF